MDEKVLVKKAKHGDVDAFGKLYEKIYRKLYQFAYFSLKNKEDAEDVVSETFMDAFEQIKKLRSEEAFSAWMYRILSNKCKQRLKLYSNNLEYGADFLEQIEDKLKVESTADRIDLVRAMELLSDEERYIIAMNVVLGYTTKEIADMLGKKESTVRSKKSRSIIQMRTALRSIVFLLVHV